jgi:hypothetical protein
MNPKVQHFIGMEIVHKPVNGIINGYFPISSWFLVQSFWFTRNVINLRDTNSLTIEYYYK